MKGNFFVVDLPVTMVFHEKTLCEVKKQNRTIFEFESIAENWLYNNYSMSPSWIWSDKITNERVARVGYNHFISNKGEWNNCFSKFSSWVLPPIFISTILQSVRREHTTSGHRPSPEYYITKSWMKVTATQTTICRQLVAKTKLELFNRSNTR